MPECPNEVRLSEYLRESLSPQDRRQIEDHVEQCAACEAVLEAT